MIKFLALVMAVMTTMWNCNSEVSLYGKTMVVIELDYENDIVVCEDFNEMLWTFEGCEDWLEGDVVSAIMHDNGTSDIYDDVILSTKYDGYMY